MQPKSTADRHSPPAQDPDGEPASFGQLLKRYRQEAGLTQEALAERAGLSVRGIQDLERGVTKPLKDTVRRLLGALPIPPAERAHLEAVGGPAPRRRPAPATPVTVPQAPRALVAAQRLPSWPTPLVGREQDEAAVAQLLLREQVRLLTLTGPGGVGKTRIAVRMAETLGHHYSGGAAFVALAAIADPALVIPTIAHALGLREGDGRMLSSALQEYLSDVQLLLVLDNFEQVTAAASVLAGLLRAAPGLALLVTSREPLRLQGEHEYAVPPLDLPPAEEALPIEQLAQRASVALFVQRARAVRPGFTLTPQNAPAVAGICRRLDGVPLAIEIAGARVRVLPPQDLLARLDAQGGRPLLRLLTGGAQDLPRRQQTVRNTIAWSYELLTAAEQALFRGLAVFAGGWTLEAAEAVCGTVGGTHLDVLDTLTSLMSKSLMERTEDADGETRFHYLEVIREYGLECLEASGELEIMGRRQADYCRALARGFEPALKGPGQAGALRRFEQEIENLRTALRWACEGGDVAMGLRTAGALWRIWEIRGYLSEGRQWFSDLLARAELSGATVTPAVRAQALLGLASLAYRQSDYTYAATLLEESVALWRAVCDDDGVAVALNMIGNIAMATGASARAKGLYLESLDLRRRLGDRWGCGVTLNNLGIVAEEERDYAQAVAWYEESLAIRRQLGDASGIAGALGNLGAAHSDRGDLDAAAACFSEALALQRALGDRRGIAVMLNHSGALAYLQGRWDEAATLLREGLTLAREMGDRMRIAAFIETLGSVKRQEQRPDRAVRLVAAAQTLQEAIKVALTRADSAGHDRELAELRATLGEDAFRTNWTIGAAWSLEQAIREALAE